MKIPPQIAFEGFDSSQSTEGARALILEEIKRLEKHNQRITGCRVSLIAPSYRHRTDGAYEVHIWLTIPPHENIVVNHEPSDGTRHDRVENAIRDAFAAARRQVDDLSRRD